MTLPKKLTKAQIFIDGVEIPPIQDHRQPAEIMEDYGNAKQEIIANALDKIAKHSSYPPRSVR